MVSAVGALARPDDPLWLRLIFADLGLKEAPGSRSTPRILEMMRTIGRPDVVDDETSWCAAAGAYYLVRAGIPVTALPPKSERLLARAYLKFGVPLRALARGCLVILKRGSAAWQGHFAFALGTVEVDGRRYVECIGGNQSNAITIARFPAESVLGFRWPEGIPLPGEEPRELSIGEPMAGEHSAGERAFSRRLSGAGKGAGIAEAMGGSVLAGAGAVATVRSGLPWWMACAVAAAVLLAAAALILFLYLRD